MKKNEPMQICILEDNRERQAAMSACIEDRFHTFKAVFFDDARSMIGHLKTNLSKAILICLDHDLEMKQNGKGKLIDPGTGRDVVDWLATQLPTCPIVIHTTNSVAARGMEHELLEKGWRLKRVTPWGDLEWIEMEWKKAVRTALLEMARPVKTPKKVSIANR